MRNNIGIQRKKYGSSPLFVVRSDRSLTKISDAPITMLAFILCDLRVLCEIKKTSRRERKERREKKVSL